MLAYELTVHAPVPNCLQQQQMHHVPCVDDVDLHHLLAVEALAVGSQPVQRCMAQVGRNATKPHLASPLWHVPHHAQWGALAQQVGGEKHGCRRVRWVPVWVMGRRKSTIRASQTHAGLVFWLPTYDDGRDQRRERQ